MNMPAMFVVRTAFKRGNPLLQLGQIVRILYSPVSTLTISFACFFMIRGRAEALYYQHTVALLPDRSE